MLKTGLSDYCSRKCGEESLKLGPCEIRYKIYNVISLSLCFIAPAILAVNNNYEIFKEGELNATSAENRFQLAQSRSIQAVHRSMETSDADPQRDQGR